MLAECVSAKNTDEFKHLYVAALYLFRLNCFYFTIVTMLLLWSDFRETSWFSLKYQFCSPGCRRSDSL